MIFGYYRSSTPIDKEKIEKRIKELKKYGAEKIYIDINQHGRTSNRPELIKLLKDTKKGDTVIIPSSNILGRRIITVNSILNRFEKKGVYLSFPEDLIIRDSIMLRFFMGEEIKRVKKEQKLDKKITNKLKEKLKEGN